MTCNVSRVHDLILLFFSAYNCEPVEEKQETPGETPDPVVGGLSGTRPLGLNLGVAVLPPLPPDTSSILPSTIAQNQVKKRSMPPVVTPPQPPPPPPAPRVDSEVRIGKALTESMLLFYFDHFLQCQWHTSVIHTLKTHWVVCTYPYSSIYYIGQLFDQIL